MHARFAVRPRLKFGGFPYERQLRETLLLLRPARGHISPIWHYVGLYLISIRAVGQRHLAVGNLIAGASLLDKVPGAECVLVLESSAFIARERDRPVGAVDFSHHGCAGIPLWEVAIEQVERARNVDCKTGGIGSRWHRDIEREMDFSQLCDASNFI